MKRELRHIYLVGFSGSGKSTVATRLGARLNRGVIDMDSVIGKRFGLTISQIFERHGELSFRNAETAVLKRLSNTRKPAVIATGGGCVERTVNRRIMWQSGIVIYLQCSVREISRRLRFKSDRPMLSRGKSRSNSMKLLLSRRKPLYTLADMKFSTTNLNISQVVTRIMTRLRESGYAD